MSSMRPSSAVERAFQIARSGEANSVDYIRRKLGKEGYNYDHIYGRTLCSQLCEVIRGGRSTRSGTTHR